MVEIIFVSNTFFRLKILKKNSDVFSFRIKLWSYISVINDSLMNTEQVFFFLSWLMSFNYYVLLSAKSVIKKKIICRKNIFFNVFELTIKLLSINSQSVVFQNGMAKYLHFFSLLFFFDFIEFVYLINRIHHFQNGL